MDIIETIKEQIANNTILLYMKGRRMPRSVASPRKPRRP
jgi:hypothetical protein